MPREKLDAAVTEAEYHLMTRTVDKQLLFEEEEKTMMQLLLRRVAEYTGIKIFTHVEMGSHVHIYVCVPKKEPVDDKEILRRYCVLYDPPSPYAQGVIDTMARKLEEDGFLPKAWRDSQLAMENDVSPFMQIFKQRTTFWYNPRHHRIGPLWNERFVSQLIGHPRARPKVAAYVDNNPVRAGLCQDPKDYPHCGYSEAVAGNEKAQEGIMEVMGEVGWNPSQAGYRIVLYENNSITRPGKATVPQEERARVLAAGGNLTAEEILRVTNRYLTLGVAIGDYDFIQSRIDVYRQKTGRGSRMKPVPVPACTGLIGLYTLRRPRKNRDF